MKRSLAALVTAAAIMLTTSCLAQDKPTKSLDIYFLDMVGGGSTLIVTPLGESVLIDTGSREPQHRDADRILKACQYAGLKQIDYLVTTHFDSDHFGGILEVSNRIPIRCFLDNGSPTPSDNPQSPNSKLHQLYQQATKGTAKPIRPGDDILLKNDPNGQFPQIKLHCIAAGKQIEGFSGDIDAPVEGFEMKKPDNSENARSVALVLHYGKFDFFAGGDITLNVEQHLAHPVNRVGQIDLYQVTHHGLDQSNNPLLVKTLSPTVCVAMNGPRKGIDPRTFKTLKELPSVKAIYQIHYNTQYGEAGNTAPEFIANLDDPKKGELIKASVFPDKGVFTISIGPTGPQRPYEIK
jgi:beta-lactamase superfamily II metal-dependent hydrolase